MSEIIIIQFLVLMSVIIFILSIIQEKRSKSFFLNDLSYRLMIFSFFILIIVFILLLIIIFRS